MIRMGPRDVGTHAVRHAVQTAVAGHDVHGIAALRLDDRGKLPAARQDVPRERQSVGRAEDESVAGIEIRQAVLVGNVVAVLDGKAGGIERVGVERLRPGVRGVELQTARQAFGDGHPGGVVARKAAALHLRDVAEGGARKYGAGGRQGGEGPNAVDGLIDVARDPKVRAAGARVSQRHGQLAGELPLHVHVPRLHRRVPEPGIDRRRGEPCGPRRLDRADEGDRACRRERRGEWRIAGRVPDRRRARFVHGPAIGRA